MLFGKPKVEEIPIISLENYFIALFNTRSAKNVEKCQKALKRIEDALSNFEAACHTLAEVDANPDDEYINPESFSALKVQKASYVKALTSSIDIAVQDMHKVSSATEYENILYKMQILKNLKEHLLKLNSSFRNVLLGYGGYFSNMKKAFKEVENSIGALQLEIDNGSADFSKYQLLMNNVKKLNSLVDTFEANKRERTMLIDKRVHKNTNETATSERTNLSMKIDSLLREIRDNEAAEQSILSKINSTLMPLERAARKYDHESKSASKLSMAIANAFASLEEGDSYANFINMLKDMQNKISSIETDERELQLTKHHLEVALGTNLAGYAQEVSKLRDVRKGLLSELKEYKAASEAMNSLKAEDESIQNAILQKDELDNKLSSEINSLAKHIEIKAHEYYRKDISISYKL